MVLENGDASKTSYASPFVHPPHQAPHLELPTKSSIQHFTKGVSFRGLGKPPTGVVALLNPVIPSKSLAMHFGPKSHRIDSLLSYCQKGLKLISPKASLTHACPLNGSWVVYRPRQFISRCVARQSKRQYKIRSSACHVGSRVDRGKDVVGNTGVVGDTTDGGSRPSTVVG